MNTLHIAGLRETLFTFGIVPATKQESPRDSSQNASVLEIGRFRKLALYICPFSGFRAFLWWYNAAEGYLAVTLNISSVISQYRCHKIWGIPWELLGVQRPVSKIEGFILSDCDVLEPRFL